MNISNNTYYVPGIIFKCFTNINSTTVKSKTLKKKQSVSNNVKTLFLRQEWKQSEGSKRGNQRESRNKDED